ncbi:MAG: DNA mismatch repair endonuclease MutL [Lachnospiraceae bacterium]|nr:DNA mismatch repair endonuclease MutL [Lachnospiraceae bacterium]
MAKIQVLDSDTINQIAAGEVVERPASVVKELVENAIDAGASAITVEIKEGGIGFIRITDNGSGIPGDDIPLAFLRHATSKIATALDLLTVKSLGFRGEALSSIASVAMVELVTKTREDFVGKRYVIEGGEEKAFTEIGAPEGTTFLVRSLFYNTPARRKFLKSAMTEGGYINELMERFAISHPEIAFKFINQNKTVLQTTGNGNLKDCIYHIYGREITAALLPVQESTGEMTVSGFIAKPVVSRGNRNFENYFINGRYIRSNIITKAIEEAYKPYTMQHKYPFTALLFEIPTEQIDVNVHPTKLEIRFTNGEALYQMVYHAVRDALAGKNMIPEVRLTEEKEKREVKAAPEPFETKRLSQYQYQPPVYSRETLRTKAEEKREEGIRQIAEAALFEPTPVPNRVAEDTGYMERTQPKEEQTVTNQEVKPVVQAEVKREMQVEGKQEAAALPAQKTEGIEVVAEAPVSSVARPDPLEMVRTEQLSLFEATEQREAFMKKEAADEHQILGQLFGTYWLVQFKEQLFIIDQHAAHEKILYEHTVSRMKEKEMLSQQISPPIVLSLSLREEEALKRYLPQFQALGFEIEEFGGREYMVSALPADMYGVDGKVLLIEMLDSLLEEPLNGTSDLVLDRIASLSCKAAVKGNTRLSEAEARALIAELLTLENPFHCPHGRPVIIAMSKHEIERKFKRIVN